MTVRRFRTAQELAGQPVAALRTERDAVWGRMTELYAGIDAATRAGRQPLRSAEREYDALEGVLAGLDGAIVAHGPTVDRTGVVPPTPGGTYWSQSGGPELLSRVDPWDSGPLDRLGDTSPRPMRGRALAAVDRLSTGMPSAAAERVTRALETDEDPQGGLARYVVEASRPDYLKAFSSWLRDPARGHLEWSPEERDAFARVQTTVRNLGLGTGAAGGFLVPYQLDPAILISGAGSVDPMRAVSRQILTAYNEARLVTSAGVTSSWDAEAVEVSDDSPTLAQPAITCYKGQGFVPVSFELFEDSTIAEQVGEVFADSKAQLESSAFTTGSGTAQPKGVVTAINAVGGSVVTGSPAATFNLAGIVAVQNALPARWRPRARFMANLTIMNSARQIPLYTNGPAVLSDATGTPRMLGWDVAENSTMVGTTTTGSNVLLAGDFQQYVIADRVGTMIEFVPVLFGANQRPTGQRGFLLHWRTGGDAVITDAFRLLKMG